MTEQPGHSTVLEGEKFEALSLVVGQVAHDFNNLLTPLLAYPQLIKSDLPEGAYGTSLVDVVEKTAKDMVHITKQLLDLTTKRRFEKRSANVNTIVDKALQEIRRDSLPEGVALEWNPGEGLPTIEASSERLAMAIYNLCLNGIEAVGPAGRVTVETRCAHEDSRATGCGHVLESGDYVRVTVKDTGPGIPPEVYGKVFEPFVTTKKASGRRGAGLGLSVAYRVMRDHGGYIDYRSAGGEGTAFHLLIPTGGGDGKGAAGSATAAAMGGERVACNRDRVLIVDDDKTIFRLFQTLLSSGLPGVKTDSACNGQEAVEAFRKGHHAVILMDIHMPFMDGQAAYSEIEKMCGSLNWKMPSVVFCTGFVPPDAVRSIVAANPAHALLPKPINGKELVEMVKSRLGP